ncbi:MAG: HTH domain-containing protein [Halococcoides sp.]
MTDSHHTPGRTVEVCLRTDVQGVVAARQSAVLDRVRRLKHRDRIDGMRVRRWGKCVLHPGDVPPGVVEERAEVVEEIFDAVQGSDLSLSPAFRRTEDHGGRPLLYLPVVGLLIREGDRIVGVYPVSEGEDRVTVDDALSAIEDGEDPANVEREMPDEVPPPLA